VAADRRLRFGALGPDDTPDSFFSADVAISTKEVYGARAESGELRHDRVVIITLRDLAVRDVLRRANTAGGVREVRIEGLARKALGGDGLSLTVELFAV